MQANFIAPFRDKRFVSALVASFLVNFAALLVLSLIVIGGARLSEDFALDSILEEKPEKPEEQIQVLRKDDKIATTLNTMPGGLESTKIQRTARRSMQAAPPTTVNELAKMEIAAPTINATGIGRDQYNVDLGEENFKGEPTAIVAGYGDALNRITQEIIRLMRKDKLLVVWLFDESESMKDDQKKIAENFHIVYEELRIVQGGGKGKLKFREKGSSSSRNNKKAGNAKKSSSVKKGKTGRKRRQTPAERSREFSKAVLLTSIYGYGEKVTRMLPPTADADTIIGTIREKINIDESGKENTCAAIVKVIQANRRFAAQQKRKMVVIVVTDESGDDGMAVEAARKTAQATRTPLYFLGREAIFGYPYARQRWIDPKYKLPHWIQINRGPETSYPECLQWDGLHSRWDAFSSGFGPYEQVRLARETNGIFFVLPDTETNLAGAGSRDERQFAADAMREYHPMWQERSIYDRERGNSKFRKTIWDVIVALNPTKHSEMLIPRHDPQLNIREHHYSIDPAEFKSQAAVEVVKAYKAWVTLAKAIQLLESIEPLRAKERSTRWRANYDLARAQCRAYRVRLFQFMLRMDQHVNASPPRQIPKPRPGRKKSNQWWFGRSREMLNPDDAQFERVKQAFKLKITREEFMALLKKDEDTAREQYQLVLTRHPGTPWARRARWELANGFGMHIYDVFWDPRYNRREEMGLVHFSAFGDQLWKSLVPKNGPVPVAAID
jgi:hypothetical protein